jgi:hypothetical protein
MKDPVISDSSKYMNAPDFTLLKVRAWGAASYIRKALLNRAEVIVMCEDRVAKPRSLSHGAEYRSDSLLAAIWPFSLLAPHDVVYHEYRDATKEYVTTFEKYKKREIAFAIDKFLEGLPEDAEITINVFRED